MEGSIGKNLHRMPEPRTILPALVAIAGLAMVAQGCSPPGDALPSPLSPSGSRASATIEFESAPGPSVRGLELDLPLSVEEAYAAIPHRRTEFDFAQQELDPAEQRYLESSFQLIEQATRARVVAYRDLYHRGQSPHRPVEQLAGVLRSFEALDPPRALRRYDGWITEALEDQLAVLGQWQREGTAFAHRDRVGQHPDVRSASRALHRAYDELLKRYGDEASGSNRDALFDYHCALDFL